MSGLPSPELSTLLVDLWMVGLFFVGGWDIPMNTDSHIHGETVRELHLRAVVKEEKCDVGGHWSRDTTAVLYV